MSDLKPNETHCDAPVMFRYTWPGKDEAFVCFTHAIALANIAAAMGFHIQLIPLRIDEIDTHACSTIVKDGE